ncbi:DUF4190 domain-containing protein [Mycetocola zhujimingii]|uniref:DUF4190 domain-containing protein n=1 Tax=Mycetocola zhujimingii TaxID=2079792 RepID=UPI000D37870E|nr:DUF4190 domain-containing protein [Mycetocola zhujimingii]AWB87669.1 hypothetical protein C3E77_14360 [Mycetocola zhujimingii]
MTNLPPSPYHPADSAPQNAPQNPPAYGAAPDAGQGQSPYGYPEPATGAPAPNRGKPGLAALVLGIASVVTAFIPIVNFLSFLLGIAGIICGIVGLRRAQPERRQAVWGTVLSAVSIALAVLMIVVYTFGFIAYVGSELDKSYNNDSSSSSEPTPPPAESLALGTPIELIDLAGQPAYEATLSASVLNANDQVLAVASNTEPPAGMKWAMVTVDVTALSSVHVSPAMDIAVGYVTSNGYEFSPLDLYALAPEPRIELLTDLAEGESGTGNVVIAIPDDNSLGGYWTLSYTYDDAETDPFYFAVE